MARHMQITINREFGSGGRLIGEALAKKLGVRLVDKLILEEAAKAMKMSPNYLKQFEEKAPSIWDGFNYSGSSFHGMSIPLYCNKVTNNELYIMETELIRKLSQEGACVFIGRCANYLLKDELGCISIFLYGDMPSRIKKLTEKYGFIKEKNIEKEVEKIDKQRANYYKMYTGENWRNMKQYDLCIDTSKLGIDDIVEIIYRYVQRRKWIL